MDMIKLDDLKAYRDDRIASGDSDFDEMDRLSAFIATVETIDRNEGKWIPHFDDIWPEDSMIQCSECGEFQPMGIDENFCPYCGARMKGADDE